MKHSIYFTLIFIALSGFSISSQASFWGSSSDFFKGLSETIELPKEITETATAQSLKSNASVEEIQEAFKEALSISSKTVVNQLSLKDGFNANPDIRILLPHSLKTLQYTLKRFGMSGLIDDLEIKLNRAAEAATPEAKALFLEAIKGMKFEDVKRIYNGPKDSATQYLKETTSPDLKAKLTPIVERSLQEVGALASYDKAISNYKNLPFVPDVKADLLSHVLDKTLNGLFHYVAQEEAKIRQNPMKQSTELLKKVFSQ